MAIELRRRPSRNLDLLLVASIFVVVIFGAIFASARDWTSGAFALIGAINAAYLGALRLRLRGEPQPPAVSQPRDARAFTTRARHLVGPRFRDGYVVIGAEIAGFVPTSDWRHLAAEVAIGLVASPLTLADSELDAADSPALASELAALVERRGGFLVDGEWSWAQRGEALARTIDDVEQRIALDDDPPAAYVARWSVRAPISRARQRRLRQRAVSIAGTVTAVIAGAGVVGWRATGNSDFVVAGLVWAGLIAGGVGLGLKRIR
jgi:hypothetical protein